MAIPTKFSIKHKCGHTQARDLAHVPAGKRKAHAFGISKNQDCIKCFRAADKEFLEQKNREVLVAAQGFEEEHGLPELTGSEKQIPWATRLRYQCLTEVLDNTDAAAGSEVIQAAKALTRSGWWLDNTNDPDLELEDLVELITTAVDEKDLERIETENPF
ncbi:hypothetical protein M3D92_10565 [Micrococcus terreus]|uniref:hypothetical protein n=1 Tax=Micrococcus terreus TaxID=574650 RepID=UPI0021A48734|nr:hypothetical protein [Micrococcus terreus]MCT2089726.1 hypothetical protein [Micrococcus terreus]